MNNNPNSINNETSLHSSIKSHPMFDVLEQAQNTGNWCGFQVQKSEEKKQSVVKLAVGILEGRGKEEDESDINNLSLSQLAIYSDRTSINSNKRKSSKATPDSAIPRPTKTPLVAPVSVPMEGPATSFSKLPACADDLLSQEEILKVKKEFAHGESYRSLSVEELQVPNKKAIANLEDLFKQLKCKKRMEEVIEKLIAFFLKVLDENNSFLCDLFFEQIQMGLNDSLKGSSPELNLTTSRLDITKDSSRSKTTYDTLDYKSLIVEVVKRTLIELKNRKRILFFENKLIPLKPFSVRITAFVDKFIDEAKKELELEKKLAEAREKELKEKAEKETNAAQFIEYYVREMQKNAEEGINIIYAHVRIMTTDEFLRRLISLAMDEQENNSIQNKFIYIKGISTLLHSPMLSMPNNQMEKQLLALSKLYKHLQALTLNEDQTKLLHELRRGIVIRRTKLSKKGQPSLERMVEAAAVQKIKEKKKVKAYTFKQLEKAIENDKTTVIKECIEQVSLELKQVEAKYLSQIGHAELRDHDSENKPQPNSNLSKYSNFSNSLTYFVGATLLKSNQLKTQKRWYQFFFKVMLRSLELNNFNTAYQILAALNLQSIRRLRIFQFNSQKKVELFHDIDELFNNKENFKVYRGKLRLCEMNLLQKQQNESNCIIPCFSVVMRDFTFTKEGNPILDKNRNLNLQTIDFFSKRYAELNRFQEGVMGCKFAEVYLINIEHEITKFESNVHHKYNNFEDIDNTLYYVSQKLQPQQQLDEGPLISSETIENQVSNSLFKTCQTPTPASSLENSVAEEESHTTAYSTVPNSQSKSESYPSLPGSPSKSASYIEMPPVTESPSKISPLSRLRRTPSTSKEKIIP